MRAIRGKRFPGKRKLLSAINSYRGYGVKYAEGGLIRPAVESLSTSSGFAASGSQNVTGEISLSEDSVNAIAARTAEGVRLGAEAGVSSGISRANRDQIRRDRLSQRTAV